MAAVAIAMMLAFMVQTIVTLTAAGFGVGAYVTSAHFVFSVFIILVIYVLAWKK